VWGESSLTAEDREYGEKIQQKQFAVVAAMARAGVPLMAGTDGPLAQAGPALHDELQMLVKAGMSPLHALQAATRNPAAFIGRLPELGTIERGKIADLVLVDADPLLDIANLRRVSTVILGGKVVARLQP
jgi:imidazolonepropionase-like amidohydrolase